MADGGDLPQGTDRRAVMASEERYIDWFEIGVGGTATVYRVRDAMLGKDVAIKLIDQRLLADDTYREAMLTSVRSEVLISRALRHIGICPIHDIYDGPRGFGVVMDLLEGCELKDWLTRNRDQLATTTERRLELLTKLAETLAYAHTQIVHRDLKPANIFLAHGDITQPVIMDFGFSVLGAKVKEDASVAYTPKYMAPEQYETPHAVGQRADLWALGIIAYELLTGEIPPCSLRSIRKTREVPRIPVSEIKPPSALNPAVPPSVDRAVLSLLHYDAERRTPSAQALVDMLRKPAAAQASGRTDGRYTNWRVLGRGGTAIVYRVFDGELNYDVAIKVIDPDIMADLSFRESMLKAVRGEVVISRMLRHENICPIHDLYDGPEGFGVVMDIIAGNELRDWMDEHSKDRLDTAEQRLQLLIKLTEALKFAHTRIVHRDLKPQNIFLRNGDITQPVIMDFGFSVLGTKVDGDSAIAYTPKYMAPEQFEAPGKVDQRADLWALGIIAYELFNGEIPPCSLRDIRRTHQVPRVAIEDIPLPSARNAAVPPGLDQAILQLLHYDMDRRIQSAGALLDALRAIRPRPLVAEPPPPVPDSDRLRLAIRIPGGEYWFGSSRGARSVQPNEQGRAKITLSPFLIDRAPVTNGDYLVFTTTTGRPPPPFSEQRIANFAKHPVVGVTYDEALAFAKFYGGTLPTEAQWECAARGGVDFAEYPWGNTPPTQTLANIDRVADTTTPVGSFPEGANAHGLTDMCGNVWEWCLDYFEDRFTSTLGKTALDPVNKKKSPGRAVRGGSFQSFAAQGRCAFRIGVPPDERRNDIGFRVVYPCDDPPTESSVQ